MDNMMFIPNFDPYDMLIDHHKKLEQSKKNQEELYNELIIHHTMIKELINRTEHLETKLDRYENLVEKLVRLLDTMSVDIAYYKATNKTDQKDDI